MSKPIEGGRVTRRIALDSLDVRARVARLLKIAADDLTDGDNDTRRAQLAVNELSLINFDCALVDGKLADGDLPGAETAMMRIAAGGNETKR